MSFRPFFAFLTQISGAARDYCMKSLQQSTKSHGSCPACDSDRRLESEPIKEYDSTRLSRNRLTLDLKLPARSAMDQVRILVTADDERYEAMCQRESMEEVGNMWTHHTGILWRIPPPLTGNRGDGQSYRPSPHSPK